MKSLVTIAAVALVLATGSAAMLTVASTPAAACGTPNCWKTTSAKRTAQPAPMRSARVKR
jgi:hypothetical protein